jgi:hypothetical protein
VPGKAVFVDDTGAVRFLRTRLVTPMSHMLCRGSARGECLRKRTPLSRRAIGATWADLHFVLTRIGVETHATDAEQHREQTSTLQGSPRQSP